MSSVNILERYAKNLIKTTLGVVVLLDLFNLINQMTNLQKYL